MGKFTAVIQHHQRELSPEQGLKGITNELVKDTGISDYSKALPKKKP